MQLQILTGIHMESELIHLRKHQKQVMILKAGTAMLSLLIRLKV